VTIEAAGVGAATASRRGRLRARLGPAAGLLVLVAVLAGAGLWFATPSGADLDQRVAAINPHPLRPSDVPPLLARAVTAAEDERFWIHHGLDTVGTARALLVDVTQLCACQGGSTITQQLVNVAYYSDQGRLQRKLPAMAVALKVELRHDKPSILADYLSVVPSGYALVGARAAACAYFGHDLDRLTLAEAAEIAGVIAAPSVYDPRRGPDFARSRRGYVLGRMVELGYATRSAADDARDAPLLGNGGGCAAA
jgi:penicillin-binding protein 1A